MRKWKDVETDLRTFIRKKINSKALIQSNYDDDTDLFSSKIISSLFLVELIVEVENMAKIEIITDDVSVRDLSTINNIIKTVKRKYEISFNKELNKL
ncbi:hypothetical protein NIE88_17345 [Sporolactobacillus shoreicorticis]|uniref:Carrier domain-containing protein n=1 Tax=Sporolactobacillus shoreicorticis TaxID=1923877 RepID=A0ABW5S3I6_9BACL|nr:hypothetical protein [Sporolactobacillus shoreicorticis]MCO7127525.1 hypothetical protein [Sporolactobacillus shoreicorticis]